MAVVLHFDDAQCSTSAGPKCSGSPHTRVPQPVNIRQFAAVPDPGYVGTMTARDVPGESRRALIVDDEAVFRTLISAAVSDFGFDTMAIATANEASDALEEFDPDVVLLDLALGEGPNGLDLLNYIEAHYGWIAVLILTSYRSPDLVAKLDRPVSSKVGYVVKSDIVELTVLQDAIEQTLDSQPPRRLPQPGVPTITRSQAEVLRLMADGLSNAAIAEQRGCSVRALERVNARLYAALGVKDDADANARVQAVGMYRDGRVDVR